MFVFFATLSNANEWAEIESFAKKKEAWLRRYLELPYGIPTDDTYRIVMSMISMKNWHCDGYFVLEIAFNNKKPHELGYPTFTEFYLKVCENEGSAVYKTVRMVA
jgi:hypothetical protein